MTDFKRKNIFERFTKQSNHYDWILLAVVVILCIGGLAFLASALSSKSQEVYQSEFIKQFLLGIWLGGVCTFVLSRVDYHTWFKYSKTLIVITFSMLGFISIFAIYINVASYGKSYTQAEIIRSSVIRSVKFLPIRPFAGGGALRWIEIPKVVNFQPVELTKLTTLIYLSAFLWKNEKEYLNLLKMKKLLYTLALGAFLILVQPDLGSVLLIFSILISAMWISGKISLKIIIPIVILVLALGATLTLSTGYRKSRLDAFLSNDSTKAFQVTQVKLAIQNGGMWGKGYGNSEFKQRDAIPEVTTDGIIAIVGEEMGFTFTILFLSLYLVFLIRGLKIAQEAPDIGGKTLAAGIAVWITSQAFLNIAGITGMIPLKGIPLPFVSSGGSSIILNLIAVGILLNISNQKEVQFSNTKSKVRVINGKISRISS